MSFCRCFPELRVRNETIVPLNGEYSSAHQVMDCTAIMHLLQQHGLMLEQQTQTQRVQELLR